jgi:hypothetical protein
MRRRLWSPIVAFLVIGAPVATTLCQLTCAAYQMHDTATMPGHAHHSCGSPIPSSGAAMTDVPHVCGHPSDDTVGVQRALQTVDASAVIAVQPSFVFPADIVAVVTGAAHVEHSPPGTFALIVQLRV